MRFMEQNGVPVSATRYVRVMQNGEFLGLYMFVELVDAAFLQRRGLDTAGRLFKADHWCVRRPSLRTARLKAQNSLRRKYSNLRWPDMRTECPFTEPDLDYWPRGRGQCPQIFAEEGFSYGNTPNLGDIESLALRISGGDLSAFDRQNVVTEMAVQTAMLHQDRCTKVRRAALLAR